MKKFFMAATVALCLAGNSFAQENTGGSAASNSASGDINKEKIVAGVVGAGVLAAMVMNNRGSAKTAPVDPVCGTGEVLIDGVCVPDTVDPVCEAGEELVDGECVPVTTTTTVTTTVTNTVTNTVTTPVTVTTTTL